MVARRPAPGVSGAGIFTSFLPVGRLDGDGAAVGRDAERQRLRIRGQRHGNRALGASLPLQENNRRTRRAARHRGGHRDGRSRAEGRQRKPGSRAQVHGSAGKLSLPRDREAVGEGQPVEPVGQDQPAAVLCRLRAREEVRIRRRPACRVLAVDAELVHDSLEPLLRRRS